MRDVLFILGMHRSGTSAVTRVCSLLGAQLPKTLMGANPGNPKGHWESDVLVSYNDQLLEKEGYNWFDVPSWTKLRSLGKAHIANSSALIQLLESEYLNEKNNEPLLLIKDPRISLFLPEYEDVITQSKNYNEIKAIICLRSPLEVANSIYKRDKLDKVSAQLVWLIYMLYAERSSRHLKRTFIFYADLFTGSAHDSFLKRTSSLDIQWENETEAVKQSIDEFITPALYRQKFADKTNMMLPLVEKAYEAFLNLANNTDIEHSSRSLDEIFDVLQPILLALSSVREIMFADLKQTKKMLASSEKERVLSDAALKDLKEQYEKLESLTQLRVDELTQNMASALSRLEDTSSVLVRANNKIETLLQSEADLKHSISDLEKQKKQLEEIKNAEIQAIKEEMSQVFERAEAEKTRFVQDLESKAAHQTEAFLQSEADLKHVINDLESQKKQLEEIKNGEIQAAREDMSHVIARSEDEKATLIADFEKKTAHQIKAFLQTEADLKHVITDLENQKKRLEEIKNSELQAVEEKFSQRLEAAENELTSQVKTFESLEADYRKLEELYLSRDKDFASLQHEYHQLEILFLSKTERISTLENETLRLEEELDALKVMLQEKLLAKDMQIDWLEKEHDNIIQSQNRIAAELETALEVTSEQREQIKVSGLELEETQAYARAQHAQIDELTQKLALTEETVRAMQASHFWKLRNLLSFRAKDPRFSSEGRSVDLEFDNNLTLKSGAKTIKDWLIENEPDGWIEGADEEFRFSLDNLELNDGVQHLWGWAFDVSAQINSVEIIGLDSSFNIHIRKAESNKTREDVEAVFGGKNARMSGFSFLGSCADPTEDRPAEMAIIFRFANKKDRLISLIEPNKGNSFDNTIIPNSDRAKARWNIKKGTSLIRSGEFDKLVSGVSRVFGRRLKQSDILDDHNKAMKVAREHLAKGAELIFDHSLGGGCNAYSRTRIDELVHNGKGAVVLSYSVQSLRPTLRIIKPNNVIEEFFIKDVVSCLHYISPDVKNIFINNLVSFPKPELLIDTLTKMVEEHSIHLSIAFHEHYAICPSHFLLDAEGRFCDVPEVNICKSCLHRNPYGFTSLAESQDVEIWRQKWGQLLSKATSLLFFSQATLDLVSRAFPHLDQDKINVVPHLVDLDMWTTIEPNYSKGLKIGVVGFLSHHKGAEIVQNLAVEIAARQLDVSIYIIGNIDGDAHSLIETTGPYNHDQLPSLIEDSGANVFIMPSIVPETFSYVTAELMALNLPIISFDFGAPAERLKTYKLGETMPLGSSAEILDSVLEFYSKIKNL